ncbi:MAG: hypothetical protein Q4F97_08065 [Bacteroidales bacterium]|nr:hypothetical protein [Bacteroidales bacterium]
MYVYNISRSNNIVPITILCSLILGLLSYFTGGIEQPETWNNALWNIGSFFAKSNFMFFGINTLILLISGWILYKISEYFTLSQHRSYLPFLFFILFEFTSTPLTYISKGSFVFLFVIPALITLFQSFQERNSSNFAFLTGMFLGLLSFIWIKGLILVPIFIIGYGIMRSLTFRSFLALILGTLSIFWIEFVYFFFNDESLKFISQFKDIFHISIIDINSLSVPTLIMLSVTLFFSIITGGNLFFSSYLEKIKTQMCYKFLLLLNFFGWASLIFSNGRMSCELSLIFISLAMMTSNFFQGNERKYKNVLFILMIATYLFVYVMRVWID